MPENIDKTDRQQFYNELDILPDGGVAIVSCAYLDALLTDLLRHKFIDDENAVNKLLGKDENGGKLTFDDKATLVYCLGLLPNNNYLDLLKINTIKNKFAHRKSEILFSDLTISPLCYGLQTTLPNTKLTITPRLKFQFSVVILISTLEGMILELESNQQRDLK